MSPRRFLTACVLGLGLALAALLPLHAAMPADVLQVTATTSATPPHVTLSWPPLPFSSAPAPILWRRVKGADSWGSSITLPSGATSYADPDAQPGVAYEYSVRTYRPNNSGTLVGAIVAGHNVPLVEQRGNVLLYVDATQATTLAPELQRLRADLVADGWTVFRHDGPREAHPASSTNPANHAPRKAEREVMLAVVKNYYDSAPNSDWALLIIGRAPVAYSGLLAPDGHIDHRGAWPTDTYYAEFSENYWTDSSVDNSAASDPRNRNVPGDGKFDQNVHPPGLKLQVGRIDLAEMDQIPAGFGETTLLRQYLVRNHRFRRGLAPYDTVARRGLIDNGFAGMNFTAAAWRNATSLFGASPGQVDELDWFSTLQTTSVLYAYGEGGGTFTSAGGIGTSTDFATKDSRAVFTVSYGSYFGDWDTPANFLRAPIAGTPGSLGLTSLWNAGASLFHMALGETIGYGVRFTQNDTTPLSSGGWIGGGRSITVNLLGDPTLRLHSIRPPAHVVATSTPTGVALSWQASPDAIGYHVYRADTPAGPFTRLSGAAATGADPLGSPLNATGFTDSSAISGNSYTYLVKAVRMETTASGTYANQSLGDAVTIAHQTAGSTAPAAPTGLVVTATGTSSRALVWRDNAVNETGYLVERLDLATGQWSVIATPAANSSAYSDLSAPSGRLLHYRVRATGPSGNSHWSNVAADYTLPGVAQPSLAHLVASRNDGSVALAVRRLHGNVGDVSLAWSTADLNGLTGTEYPAAAGTLGWAHGSSAVQTHSISLAGDTTPRLTRFIRVNYTSPTHGLALASPAYALVQVLDPATQRLPGWSSQIITPSSDPAPWAGYAEYHDGAFGLAARTGNVGTGGTADSMRFLYLPVTGDCQLTVRLASITTELNAAPRTGIMIRASLDPGATLKGIHATGTGSLLESRRTTTNGPLQTTSLTGQPLPQWLRLQRSGNLLRAYRSTNGTTWTQHGPDTTLSLPSTAYVGLFLSSNTQDVGEAAYARFDNISVEAALNTPPSLRANSGPGAGQIELAWTAVPGAQSYELQRSPTAGSGYATIATPAAPEAFHSDTGLAPRTPLHYHVRAIGSAGQSAWSPVVAVLPYLPAGIEGWRYLHFDANVPADLAGDLADPDGDGRSNLLEYALGSDPLFTDTAFAPSVAVRPTAGSDHLTLAFVRDPATRGVKLRVESANELGASSWESFDPLLPERQVELANNTPLPGFQRIVVRDSQPLAASPRRFMRLRVTRMAGAEIYTGFEPDSGYFSDSPVAGFDDPGIPGDAVWTKFNAASSASITASSANPLSGSQALRIVKTDTTTSSGLVLDLAGAGPILASARAVTLRFSLAITSFSAGTGSQLQIYFGAPAVNPTGGKYWTGLVFNEGSFLLYRSNSAGTANQSLNLGAYATYAEPGGYVTVELRFDPVSKTYLSARLSGPKSSVDFSATLAGSVLPWIPNTADEPAKALQLVVGSNDLIHVDIDELSLGAAE